MQRRRLRKRRTFTSYPANYYTGPLGARNVLPASTTGAMFGLWVGIADIAGGASGQYDYLVDHITDLGRSPELIGSQEDTYTFSGILNEDHIHSLGAVPVVALAIDGGMFHGFSPTQILAGSADTALNTLADRYAAKSYRIMVAPCREFDLVLDISTPTAQGLFRDAWAYMVNRFQARGATNVGWYFTPSEQADGGGIRARQDACYPGHAYVDWVGSTGYNQDRANVYTTPLHDLWTEFREIFAYEQLGAPYTSFYAAYGPNKPFIPAETGCLFSNTGNATRKKNWFMNIDDVAKANMPNLRGSMYFGQMVGPAECYVDWRGYSNAKASDNFECDGPGGNCFIGCGAQGTFDQNSWDGYVYWASRPRWNVGVSGGL